MQLAPLRYGPVQVGLPVVLAPMAGVTDLAFRTLCWRAGAGLCVSQMVSARAIVEGNEKTHDLLDLGPGEPIASIQLYAVDPRDAHEAVRIVTGEHRVDHVDLNFGCPARKVTRHGGGAAVPFKRGLYGAIVSAAVDAAGPIPVTVKFRKGIDDGRLTHLDSGRIAEQAGAAAVALHGRTAEQLYSGDADWDAILELKDQVRTIPVLGNGDIWEAGDAVAMLGQSGADGVVIGRGCLGRPWLFSDLADALSGRSWSGPPKLGELAGTILEHARLVVETTGDESRIRGFRKHLAWYLTGYPVGKPIRRLAGSVADLADVEDLLDRLDPHIGLPVEAHRLPRGHTAGPKPVSLPEGYLDDPDEAFAPASGAAVLASGG